MLLLTAAGAFRKPDENGPLSSSESGFAELMTEFADKRVFWPRNVFPANYRDYRVGTDRDSKRAIDEIPPEELANAM